MKKHLLVALLASTACGFPTATHCDGTGFGQGLDSVLPVDCAAVVSNFENGLQILGRNALHVDPDVYRHRMQHVHVEVRSLAAWQDGSQSIIGITSIDPWSGHVNIEVSKYGYALLHETLHAYALVSYFDSVDGVLAFPIEGEYDANHAGWEEHCVPSDLPGPVNSADPSCGYYDADRAYMRDCEAGSGCQSLFENP